jgi:hypothetical protein
VHAVDPTTAGHHRRYPSISLLLPLDGPTPWPARLRGLQREATSRLHAEFGSGVDHQLLARLEETVGGAIAPPGARSLAVFVNGDGAHAVGVAVAVRERAVIDDTFATRDLVHHDLRSPRYWVLALSLDEPRLLHGHGGSLHLQPLELRDTSEQPSGNRDRRGRDRSDVLEARRARRLRALDVALTDALAGSGDPVIVVGAEPTLSRFLDRTRHIAKVESVVRRAPDPDLAVLRRIIEPAVAEVLGERRALALDALQRSVGAGTSASGIDQVWHHARRIRGGVLVVEEQFEQPALVAADGTLAAAADAAAAGVVDDIVDEVIELVLAAGGRVELVPDGRLAAHQRIAYVPPSQRKR